IAQFQARQLHDDEGGPRVRRLAVQSRRVCFLFAPTLREPRRLGPGVYSVANLVVRAGHDDEGSRIWGYITCEESELPITATLVLPTRGCTMDRMAGAPPQSQASPAAGSSLCRRPADTLLGGSRLQLSFLCSDPVRLINAFGKERISEDMVE